ncbi:COMPASS complex protein [Fistulina hepatica ATCC 64428]|uniref:COMPASS complex protein n=1 Tax=Fistulina hepatica ATCC 64428 TaxID=1128425 RepID=A0A0D7A5I0_9AGAR|nr:COMPASS complex protein [Fistulina hepatica ATCC 64428]
MNVAGSSTSYPTAVRSSLGAVARFVKFDPSGRYVAAGRWDGTTSIWDVETGSCVRILDGHVKEITSADWSRNSRYVLTSSKDWNVVVWDLTSEIDPPQRHTTIRFDSAVMSASFHPRNSLIILALTRMGEVYLVDLRHGRRSRDELCDDDESRNCGKQISLSAARFDLSGKHIFVGTSVGSILVFNTRTKMLIARYKIPAAGIIRGFDFTRGGRRMVTNSSDRILRQFDLPAYPNSGPDGAVVDQELEPTHKFSDPINKSSWHAMSYSPDGNWLAGGSTDPAGHKIYVWDIGNGGQFASALDGGPDSLASLQWHPTKSCWASTSRDGFIFIWHHPKEARWGAFAAGFEELSHNVEYQEREDEFDDVNEAEILRRKLEAEEKDIDIDAIEPSPWKDKMLSSPNDVDAIWADEEPDDDEPRSRWSIKRVGVV